MESERLQYKKQIQTAISIFNLFIVLNYQIDYYYLKRATTLSCVTM